MAVIEVSYDAFRAGCPLGATMRFRQDNKAPVTSIRLTGLVAGTKCVVVRRNNGQVLMNEDAVTTEVKVVLEFYGDMPVSIYLHHLDYTFVRLDTTLTGFGLDIPMSQFRDRNYDNPGGIGG